MKLDRGMETLMTVFSGVAALMCLLVGLQLLSLETRISQEGARSASSAGHHYRQWENEVRTGAVMSFGAGILILLFGVRHQATRRQQRMNPGGGRPGTDAADDTDAWTVRIFEMQDDAAPVEITAPEDEIPERAPDQEPAVWSPLAEDDLEIGTAQQGDPADSILDSIQEATGAGPARPPGRPRRSFWSRLFRR